MVSNLKTVLPQCLGGGTVPYAADCRHRLPHSALWRHNQQRSVDNICVSSAVLTLRKGLEHHERLSLSSLPGLLFLVVYFSLLALLLSPLTSMAVVTSMQAFNMPAIIIGRVGYPKHPLLHNV